MRRFGVLSITMMLVFAVSSAASAATTIHVDESSFLSAIQPGYYLEDFGGFTYGSFQGASLGFGPVNGFSYTASASNNLYSGPGNMSTNSAWDTIVINFTGSPVTAVGGIFWPTDIGGGNVIGDIHLSLSDGTTLDLDDANFSTFRGFVTDGAAFTSISIDSVYSDPDYIWPTVDHFYVGQAIGGTPAVPAPGALGLVALGLGFVARLRRKTA